MVELLVCSCGDCTHWEIGHEVLICKSCGRVFPTPGIGDFMRGYVDTHESLNWKDHER